MNNLDILKKLNKKNYFFRNKIDLIRWKSGSKKSGAFYHADGMDNQISLMMLLSKNQNLPKCFSRKTNNSILLKLNNFFVGDKFKNSRLNKIMKIYFYFLTQYLII